MKGDKKYFFILSVIMSASALALIAIPFILYFSASNSDDTLPPTMKTGAFVISQPLGDNYDAKRNAEIINGRIEYTNAGSGSCPPVIDEVEYDRNSDTYKLYIKKYGNMACTMDLRGVKQIIEYKDGTVISSRSQVEIVDPAY